MDDVRTRFWQTLAEHTPLGVLTDFDGTLVPFAATPDEARPTPALLDLVADLSKLPGVSARCRAETSPRSAPREGPWNQRAVLGRRLSRRAGGHATMRLGRGRRRLLPRPCERVTIAPASRRLPRPGGPARRQPSPLRTRERRPPLPSARREPLPPACAARSVESCPRCG